MPFLGSLARSGKAVAAVAFAAALLSACANDTPTRRSFPEMNFSSLPPYDFAASGPQVVETASAAAGNTAGDHVEHLMPIPPDKAIRTWASQRLRGTGIGADTLRVEIREASVVETTLPTKGGVTGYFTDEPDTRYEGRATVAIQIVTPDGRVGGEVLASTWRTKELMKKASLAQREQAWYDLVDSMVKDLDAQFAQGIPNYLSRWRLNR